MELILRKLPALLLIILVSALLAGLYGILHDQLTYTISPEYYTELKFIQFRIDPYFHNRVGVAMIGFFASWWMGLIAGLVFGLTALMFNDHLQMRRACLRALRFTLITAAVFAMIGGIAGLCWPMEEIHLREISEEARKAYFTVILIHLGSYAGAVLGMGIALVRMIITISRLRKNRREIEIKANGRNM